MPNLDVAGFGNASVEFDPGFPRVFDYVERFVGLDYKSHMRFLDIHILIACYLKFQSLPKLDVVLLSRRLRHGLDQYLSRRRRH